MATHSSIHALRIPGTGEPGGLTSMGSHRVGHNWYDLAAAAKNENYEKKRERGWGFQTSPNSKSSSNWRRENKTTTTKMETKENKETQNNNDLTIRKRLRPLVLPQGLWIIFWAISFEQSYWCWSPCHAEKLKYRDTRVPGTRWVIMLSLNFPSNSTLEEYPNTHHTHPMAHPHSAFKSHSLRGFLECESSKHWSKHCLDSLLWPAINATLAFSAIHIQLINFTAYKRADSSLVW